MSAEDIRKAVAKADVADVGECAIAGAAADFAPVPENAPPAASAVPPPAPGVNAAFELWLARHASNDLGNARRLVARHGCNLMFVRETGWYFWDGGRWSHAAGARAVEVAAQATADAMYGEAAALELAGPERGEGNDRFRKRLEVARKWASGSSNQRRREAMIASAAPLLERRLEELDAEPFLFNVANGTLELGQVQPDRTVEVNFREHRRANLITRISPVAYDPELTTCPLWRQSLEFFLPDRDMRRFLQSFYGHALTGSVEEQCVLLQHGEGRNFKSTMVDTVCSVLGDYAMSIPITSLIEKARGRGGEPSPDLARLPGARLVRAAEPPRGVALDESIIKQITSGEPLIARHLNRGFFEFRPQFKLVISFNRRPRIPGTDDGIWRRLRLAPFTVQIPEEDADKVFGSKLKAEGAGILNWLLDGYRLWRERGLVVPEATRQATLAYRRESDPFAPFLASACVVTGKPEVMIAAKDMWTAYRAWCQRNGTKVLSQNALGRRLGDQKGVTKDSVGAKRDLHYMGIALLDRTLLTEPLDERHGSGMDPNADGW